MIVPPSFGVVTGKLAKYILCGLLSTLLCRLQFQGVGGLFYITSNYSLNGVLLPPSSECHCNLPGPGSSGRASIAHLQLIQRSVCLALMVATQLQWPLHL